jgi:alkanesulfonate monooxygenase SsuD/methylene tetrahydromethanopterin reductase-like flavin-dependent oxidoreductase (luciferase family)
VPRTGTTAAVLTSCASLADGDNGAASPGRPAIAVSGTPAQVISALQQAIDETGARRLLVETFSREEARLFAREVIPALKEQNATTA